MKAQKLQKLFVLLVFFVSAIFMAGCSSTIKLGDKSSYEVNKTQNILSKKISLYEKEILVLQNESKKMKENSVSRVLNARTLRENDSLVRVLNQRISFLEDKNDKFVSGYTSQGTQKRFVLRGDPQQVSDAYLTVTQKLSEGQTQTKTGLSMKGVVINDTYRNRVLVKITGPGNFYQEFLLSAKERETFDIKFYGRYTITFNNGYSSLSIVKRVTPTAVYTSNGKSYKVMATLLR